MADKNSVADWDTTAANNTDVGGISIAENATAVSDFNNALRETMAQVKTKFDSVDSDIEGAVPPGAVAHFAMGSAPTGWLKANGAAVSRTTYAALFAAISTTFGSGDGSTTFNLPDLRGEFVRGLDDGRGIDTARALGSAQADEIESHTHTASTASGGAHSHTVTVDSGGAHTHTGSTSTTGAHTHSGTTASDSHSHTGTTASDAHSHFVGISPFTGGSNFDYGTNFLAAGDSATAEGVNDRVNTSSDTHSHTFTTSSDSHSHSFTTGSAGNHSHSVTIDSGGSHTHTASTNSTGSHTHTVTVDAEGGTETRPRNIALLACIKY